MALDPVPALRPVEERASLRKAMRYTQPELAQELMVRRETISRWERGTEEPSGIRGRRYARLLAEWAAQIKAES